MSRGDLQEMEVGTKQSRTAVNANAKPAGSADADASGVSTPGQTGSWEDLGGPTPDNYKNDDDSAKIKDPAATLKTVKDAVNAKAKAAEAMKSGDKAKMSYEETELEDEEVISEEEGLSEEYQEKSKLVFEAALRSKVAQIKEALDEEYQVQFEQKVLESVEEIKSELQERVDAYLEYVASEWITENQLAVEQGLKAEMTESFLTGMRSLFEDHYVNIPEEKYDVTTAMVEKLDEMEYKLNEQIKSNIALNQRLAESVADVIFSEVCEGLALSQKDKLASLAENVEFDSEDTYREKLVTLRNSYFPANAGTQRDNSENISENTETSSQPVSGLMESYLSTLTRVSKK